MDEKTRKEIALFRFSIIAPVLHGNVRTQMKYFRQIAQKQHNVAHWGKRRYKPGTFKAWLRQYRRFGFDGLLPKEREDKGQSRKIDAQLARDIEEALDSFPFLTASALYRMLVAEGQIEMGDINENTLRKFIKDNQLRDKIPPEPRKKFEKEHINELWTADCMHGPYLSLQEYPHNKKHKVFLIAAIDDHSRMICARGWFLHENSISLEIALKQAIRRFGLPKRIYCDNGPIFSTSHLQVACARLGIALIHSRPYDSPSRGKIERFFRTVRAKFLSTLPIDEINSLEQLNQRFERWLEKEYHKHLHTGIAQTPMERYIQDLNSNPTAIKRVAEEELDRAFQVTIKRKVKNDATVSVNSNSYECPHRFIGKTVEIRFPSDKPHQLIIHQEDKPLVQLKQVQPHQNANIPAWSIRFNKEDEDEKEKGGDQ